MKRAIKRSKIHLRTRCFRLEFENDNGEWEDAGDIYVEDSKSACLKEMVTVNFLMHPHVRMVQHDHYERVVAIMDGRK